MRNLFLLVIGLVHMLSYGQVGIGTDLPHPYSILDLQSSDQGILAPRIDLTSNTMDLNSDGDGDVANQPAGLLIYNSGTTLFQGYYFWNGSEWRIIDNSTAVEPSITDLICTAAVLTPSSYTTGSPYTGIVQVPYTGGNGGSYSSGNTVVVNGLTFQLQAGKLEVGSGQLIFTVSGTPTVSSPTATTFTVDSDIVSFYTNICNITVGGEERAEITTSATLGSLFQTSDPAAGYHRFVTSPDGKFSVRAVLRAGDTFGQTDLQIRSNEGTPTIMWNAGTEYVSGQFVQGNNGMTFPNQGIWYGNGGGDGTTMGGAIDNAWGDPDVYFNSPEYRRYTWTTTDSNEKTMYILTFMMGAPNSGLAANATNCPSGICSTTKVFLKIEQIDAL